MATQRSTKEPLVKTPSDTPSKPESDLPLPAPVLAVGSPLAIWAVIHAAQTRTLDDFARYGSYIGLPFSLLMAGLIFSEWRKGSKALIFPRPRLTLRGISWVLPNYVLLVISTGVFCGAFYYAIGASIKDVFFWVQSLSKTGAIVVASAITLASGVALFFFRLRYRSIYGLTEAAIGVAVAAQRTAVEYGTTTSDPAFYLVTLTAGVYLVVRGLDNMHQGVTKEPLDPVATRVLERIKRVSGKISTR